MKSVLASQLHLSDAESNSGNRRVYVMLNADDFAHLSSSSSFTSSFSVTNSMKQSQYVLTVRACGEYYMSAHSQEVIVPPHLTALLLPWLTDQSTEKGGLMGERDQDVSMQNTQVSSGRSSDRQLLSNGLTERELEEDKVEEETEEEHLEEEMEKEEGEEQPLIVEGGHCNTHMYL